MISFLGSCEVSGFIFTADSGISVPLSTRLWLKGSSSATPVYKLKEPVFVIKNNQAFFLIYNSGIDGSVEVSFSSGEKKTYPLPDKMSFLNNTDIIHYQIPINRGRKITAFRVEGSAGFRNEFTLIGAGLEELRSGYYYKEENGKPEITLTDGMVRKDNSSFSFAPLSGSLKSSLNQVQIHVKYMYKGDLPSKGLLTLSSGEDRNSHEIILHPGGGDLFFYSDEEGFIPEDLEFNCFKEECILSEVEIKPFSRLVPVDYKPVPADLGVILKYNAKSWRRSDFEIFSWSLFPDFLIFDFRDLAIQSRFLKRLAFFVEKKGYEGKLLSNDVLEKLHGWNAHDYRAEDLARYFTFAREQKFSLNSEEYMLLDILIKNRIVKDEGSEIVPVSGGFLSFSAESSKRLRYLFITHEGYHGVFFSSPAYRERVWKVWNTLSRDEKEFWKLFLGWKGYNTKNTYLLVNEFQAYLMQQRLPDVDKYYKEYIIQRLKTRYPDKSMKLDLFLKNYPDHFYLSAEKVGNAVMETNGVTAGELRSVLN